MTDPRLIALYDRIASRCQEIGEQAEIPCAAGCDTCCRRLAQPPQLTALEWEHLKGQLILLAPAALESFRHRIEDMGRAAESTTPPQHFVCPLLDQEARKCSLYLGRPAACRTYGFYVTRGEGLWCQSILELQNRDDLPVVWGNQDAVDAELASLSGESKPLHVWFAQWRPPVPRTP